MTTDLDLCPAIPVALYARYSTDRQDSRSIDDQVRRCREYAQNKGFSVVAVYQDEAESGAHLERAQMQAMLAEARKGKRSAFRAVLVDDLSRLSRDLGATWNLVFGDLFQADVKVIDVSSGLASDDSAARIAFGASALVADMFLQTVKKQTHRGLEGRHIAGFSTGGRVYGYRTIPEPNPQDPEHPRKKPVIDEQQAGVVRRIFTMYAEGAGLATIASALNADGIPAPYDTPSREKPAGRGWSTNTIQSMLRNERYIGKVVWNKRTWYRPQHAKARRYRLRPRKDWRERPIDPSLAIVSEDLWAKVQVRLAARALGPRAARDRKFIYLLSGLLRCGSCGASMSVVSRRKKGAVSYANFGCSANHSKGEHICSNNLTVSERKVNEAVLDAVRKLLESPKFGDRFVEAYEKRKKEQKARGGVDREAVQREVRALEARVEKVTEAIATVGHSDTLLAKLRGEEAKLAEARVKLTSLAADQAEPEERPDPAEVRRQFEDLSALLDRAPERARDAARRLLTDITLTPATEGDEEVYEAVGGVKTSSAAHLGGRVLVKDGCGGALDQFSPTEKPLYTGRINPSGACNFPGCDRPLHGAGLCDGHRNQLRRGLHLTPLRSPRRKPKAA